MKKRMLALLLTLAMVLSLSVVAFADDGINTVTELKGAIANGGEIVVTGDITLTEAITISKEVKLVGVENGITITTAVIDVFNVGSNGVLTLGQNLTISSTAGAVLYAHDGGKINIAGAKVENTGNNTVAYISGNGSEMNVTAGEITNSGDHSAVAAVSGATVTISGGKVEGTTHDVVTVYAKDSGSTVNISGEGTVTSAASSAICAYESAVVNISGGTVSTTSENTFAAAYSKTGGTVNVSGNAQLTNKNGATLIAANDGKVTMSGGSVNNGVMAWESANAVAEISGGMVNGAVSAANGASMSISGGTFDTDVSAYLAEGAVLENGTVSRVEFWGTDLQLANTLNMAFYIDKDQKNDWTGCYAVVEMNNAACVYYFADDAWLTDQTEEYYYIYFIDIYAYMMDEKITVAIYNSDETQISETFKTSVAQYANAMKSADSAKYGTIVDALLAYGAAAKSFFSASAN